MKLEEICKLMEENLLSEVHWSSGDTNIKVVKAGFKAPEEPLKEAKGTEEVDDELLFWSAEG